MKFWEFNSKLKVGHVPFIMQSTSVKSTINILRYGNNERPTFYNSDHQYSRLKPSHEFHLKGSQISAFQMKGWFKYKTSIQEYRNANTKLMLNMYMNNMASVSNTM